MTVVSDNSFQALVESLRGELIQLDDQRYDTARSVVPGAMLITRRTLSDWHRTPVGNDYVCRTAGPPKMQRLQMNSYINLIIEAEGAKERLRRLFQSAPEPEKPDCAPLFEELALIAQRSSKEVVQVEFDASARVQPALKQTGLILTGEEEAAVAKVLRQRPTCVGTLIISLGYFFVHLYA